MQKLEEQAGLQNDPAVPAGGNNSAPTKGLLFVRGETQNDDEMGETKNPEEIELADSDDSDSGSESDNGDEDEEKEKEASDVPQQMKVPDEVDTACTFALYFIYSFLFSTITDQKKTSIF